MVAKVKLPTRAKDYDTGPEPIEPPATRRGGPGRGHVFTPDDTQRKLVQTLTGYGAPQKLIATLVINEATGRPIDRHTLA